MRTLARVALLAGLVSLPATAGAQSCPPEDWSYAASGLPEGCPVDLVLPTDGSVPVLYLWTDGQPGEMLTLTQEESRLVGTPIRSCDQTCHVKTLGGGGRTWMRVRFTPTGATMGTVLVIGDSVGTRAEIPILGAAGCPQPPPLPQGFACGDGCSPDCVPAGGHDDDDGCAAGGTASQGPPVLLISLATLALAWRRRAARRARRARDRA